MHTQPQQMRELQIVRSISITIKSYIKYLLIYCVYRFVQYVRGTTIYEVYIYTIYLVELFLAVK